MWLGLLGALALVAILAAQLLRQRRRIAELRRQLEELRSLTSRQLETDLLTGLGSRTALERWLDEGEPFPALLAVCDLDNFKAINDRFGHPVGDQVLGDIGHLLRSSIRQQDRVFRWGGDEFVICFRTSEPKLAENRLHMIEQRLADFHIRNCGPFPLSMTWGLAPLSPGQAPRQALQQADRQMLEAKQRRRTLGQRPLG